MSANGSTAADGSLPGASSRGATMDCPCPAVVDRESPARGDSDQLCPRRYASAGTSAAAAITHQNGRYCGDEFLNYRVATTGPGSWGGCGGAGRDLKGRNRHRPWHLTRCRG